MAKLNGKRLRSLIPILLAVLCLVCGVTLTGSIERSRTARQQSAAALQKVQEAAALVLELRSASAEQLAGRAATLDEQWRRLKPHLLPLRGQTGLHDTILLTSVLFDQALRASAQRAPLAQTTAHDIAGEAALVWPRWHRAESELAGPLMAELAGSSYQAGLTALLALIGFLASVLLKWQTSRGERDNADASLVEGRLRESDSRSRAMAETAREILIQADPSGRILRSNRKLAATEMASLFDGGERTWASVSAVLSASNGPAEVPPREVRLAGDGEGRLAEWRVYPVRDAEGQLVRIDSALLDLTAWHTASAAAQARIGELEKARERWQRQLRELLEQSFELAESRAAIQRTGELRMDALLNWGRRVSEPLQDAVALTGRLRTSPLPLPSSDTEALLVAVESVAASLASLSEFAGLERGPLVLSPASFSPRALLEGALEARAKQAEAKHLEMPCFVRHDVPLEVSADAGRLEEVLGHVIGHAVRYTASGEVAVRLVTVSRAGSTVNLRFEVEDSGAGFLPEELEAAFEPFHPALAPHEVASGLALAKRIVECMGGQIGAESAPGQGTRVWFIVPVEAAAEASGSGAMDPSLAGRRILILDHSASQRGALMEMAQSMGLDPAACSSGEGALVLMRSEAAAGSPFHYVLAEREMPGLSGAGLAAVVWEDASLAATTEAVVLMVPYSLRRVCGQLESSGVRGFLSKPVRMNVLAALLAGRADAPGEASEASGRPARKDPVPASSGAPLILIVEDNPVNQRVAVRLVEKMGYRVAVVNNGREALEAFRRDYFDLILMDCQMPEMDGFTATNAIRLLEAPGSRTPIIAMTANAMRGDRDRCIAAGMDDYISKPVGYEDLRAMVTRWLARAEVARL